MQTRKDKKYKKAKKKSREEDELDFEELKIRERNWTRKNKKQQSLNYPWARGSEIVPRGKNIFVKGWGRKRTKWLLLFSWLKR